MHRTNNVVIMQTKQLGRIEALEEELRSSRAKMAELELKTTEQDRVIAQLVGDNLEHLQDNMRLTAHITSSSDRMGQLEHWLGQVGSVLMGMIKGAIKREGLETSSSLGSGGSAASGDELGDQGGDVVNDTGGKGSITQWVHVEYMEGSETICPTFTQWVRGGYFSKVPTKVPTG